MVIGSLQGAANYISLSLGAASLKRLGNTVLYAMNLAFFATKMLCEQIKHCNCIIACLHVFYKNICTKQEPVIC